RARRATYTPAFRRFLVSRMLERAGTSGVARTRREVAAIARKVGVPALAVQVLLDGDLVSDAVELADREIDTLANTNHTDDARRLARLLPPDALAEYPHLRELQGVPSPETAEEELPQPPPGRRIGRRLVGVILGA